MINIMYLICVCVHEFYNFTADHKNVLLMEIYEVVNTIYYLTRKVIWGVLP